MTAIERSYICGVTCFLGGPNCNGYCKDSRIPAPGKYVMELVDIGGAMRELKAGKRLARMGWNGRDMFIYYVPAARYPATTDVARAHYGQGAYVPYNAYIALKNADDTVSTWAPSGSDALADDWYVVPN